MLGAVMADTRLRRARGQRAAVFLLAIAALIPACRGVPKLRSRSSHTHAAAAAGAGTGTDCSLKVAGSPAQGQHIPPETLAKGHCALSSQYGGNVPYCHKLPPVVASPGCNLLNQPALARLFSAPPRELVLYGDSITDQYFRLAQCHLAAAFGAPPVTVPAKGVLKKAGVIKAIGYHPSLARKPCLKRCFQYGSLRLCNMRVNQNLLITGTAPCLLTAPGPDDVHVFNIGVWHNSRKSLASAIHAFRGFLKAARKAGQALPHLLWRETTPQHFYTSSGDGGFDPKQRKVRCLQPEEVKADVMGAAEYRNNISLAVLADADVDVVRAWEMLRDLPQLHPQKEGLKGQVDCAHCK